MGTGDSERPDFSFETVAWSRGRTPVCGIDEAGRGPWAGPVVAAAVILDPDDIPDGINDSKKLSPDQRRALYDEIMARGLAIAVGIGDIRRIETLNILGATMWAMRKAVRGLPLKPRLALVDGNKAPKLACEWETLVSGDARSLSIAAASIIAKVTRDAMMVKLDRKFPQYGFASHKGYGTPEHQQALRKHGPCIHHRAGFAPVRDCQTPLTNGSEFR